MRFLTYPEVRKIGTAKDRFALSFVLYEGLMNANFLVRSPAPGGLTLELYQPRDESVYSAWEAFSSQPVQ